MKYWEGLSVFPSPINQKLSDNAARVVSNIFKAQSIGTEAIYIQRTKLGK